MPLYSIDAQSGLLKRKYEQTPRISIITDATDIRMIPREIRAIVRDDRRVFRSFSEWTNSRGNSDACFVWFTGECFLEGNARTLLKSFHYENRRSFIVVETPCVDDVPFLTIQPRAFANSATVDYWSFGTRIASKATPAIVTMVDTGRRNEPWGKLVGAVSAEKTKVGSGVETLVRLWESRGKLPEVVGALALRNLVAAMLLHREPVSARALLEAGAKLYSKYAEVHYLSALLAIREARFAEALPLLERAKNCGIEFPGSGGENSYRCEWLLGVLAVRTGREGTGFQNFLSGLKCNPPFEPALTEILKLRLPYALVEDQQYFFGEAARRSPAAAARIAEFLLAHGVEDAASRITREMETREKQENRGNQAVSSVQQGSANNDNALGRHQAKKQTVGIAFEGSFFEYSSLARVNREIASALVSSPGLAVRLETFSPAAHPPHLLPAGAKLLEAVNRRLDQTSLTIRHHWPPNFRRPPIGKLAVILPWEYAGVPRVWVDQIRKNVDELWVPSHFVRDVLVRAGVEPERVVVVPNGYNPQIFKPSDSSFRPEGSRDFIFLFVGGAIRRKGVDLLLSAFEAAFEQSESVTLVFLTSASAGAYRHNSLIPEIQAAIHKPKHPHVMLILDTIDDSTLADLYRGADVLVLPYRGEGFGMPLLEAMACATPVITTAEGPAKDFCDAANSYLVPAVEELVLDRPPPLGPIEGGLTWFEPAFADLVRMLRRVFEKRQEAIEKGQVAAKSVRYLTWEEATRNYAQRIRHVCGS